MGIRTDIAVATAVLALTSALGLLLAGPAGAISASQVIAQLNGERAMNGIPAGITEDKAASSACAAHNRYEHLNHALTHEEVPGKPGYSKAGAAAGRTADIASGSTWTTRSNPFQSAPLHLADLLNPNLESIGFNSSYGFTCVTVLQPLAGFRLNPPAKPIGYTYPGNGRSNWPVSERAGEGPFTPGDELGLPQPTTTGPYLMAFFAGPWAPIPGAAQVYVRSASLGSRHGKVKIKIADASVKVRVVSGRAPSLGLFLGSCAMLIPVKPLSKSTTYTAQITGYVKATSLGIQGPLTGNKLGIYPGGTYPVSLRWSFTTKR
jgi:hypothetical protein